VSWERRDGCPCVDCQPEIRWGCVALRLLATIAILAIVLGAVYLASEPVVDERARMERNVRCR
jgi:hypothetical protein